MKAPHPSSKCYSLKEMIERYPGLLNEPVSIVSSRGFNSRNFQVVLQFVGDGNYRTSLLDQKQT